MYPESLVELINISCTGFLIVTCASGKRNREKRSDGVTGITRKSHGSMLLQLIAKMSRNNSALDVCSTFLMHHFSDCLWEL
jgi:hypothetical protein